MLFKKKEKGTWKVYQDILGDKPVSIRVDTSFVKNKYKHTFYVIIPYDYSRKKLFPNDMELKKSNHIEESIEKNSG